jgi:uncharacterized membrane protein YraQ (UPF0718 family)
MDLMLTIFWGAILRMAQAVAEASPTVLCGFLIAAVFQRMLGPKNLLRLFGESGWSGLLRAWALGMLLPVCSLGVFPILRELRRAGCSGGTILAFALSAPLFNPLSFVYGLTLSEPVVIFAFAICSLIIVTVAGLVWDQLFPGAGKAEVADDQTVPPGLKRLAAVLAATAREANGPTLRYMGLAVVGVGVLSALLPFGALQTTMQHNDPLAPILMAAVALPAYDSPMKAMMQLGLIFEHGNSVGAGLTLLILGAGMNIATLVWIWKHYDRKPTLGWLGLVVGVVLVLAYITNRPLDFAGEQREGHTHAFDDFAAPFQFGIGSELQREIWPRLRDDMHLHVLLGLYGWGFFAAVGLALRVLDRFWPIDVWLTRPPPPARADRPTPFYNRHVPGPILAVVALVVLVALSIIGCYEYYPTPDVIFDEMRILKAETGTYLTSGHTEVSKRKLRRLDDLSRRLEVGVWLRHGKIDAEVRAATEQFRLSLEQLYDRINSPDFDPKNERDRREVFINEFAAVTEEFYRCKNAYGLPGRPPPRVPGPSTASPP